MVIACLCYSHLLSTLHLSSRPQALSYIHALCFWTLFFLENPIGTTMPHQICGTSSPRLHHRDTITIVHLLPRRKIHSPTLLVCSGLNSLAGCRTTFSLLNRARATAVPTDLHWRRAPPQSIGTTAGIWRTLASSPKEDASRGLLGARGLSTLQAYTATLPTQTCW